MPHDSDVIPLATVCSYDEPIAALNRRRQALALTMLVLDEKNLLGA
jgi:hypothetical protein